MKKLVIAYSGGLDTSYCAVSLSKKYDVHAVSVNTGGFTQDEINGIIDSSLEAPPLDFHSPRSQFRSILFFITKTEIQSLSFESLSKVLL